MKKIICLFAGILIVTASYSQKLKCDRKLLDQVLISMIGKSSNPINVYEQPLIFSKQETFFKEAFFERYTHPVVGVDTVKVKELIKNLDFDYLAKQRPKSRKWNFAKSKLKINPYTETPNLTLNGQKQYKIARPIYSSNRKFAFVYYHRICGKMDCSSEGVKVFKKLKGKWIYYVNIPLSN